MRSRRNKSNTKSQKGLGNIYQLAYSSAFALAFVTYFVRRFLADQQFFYLATVSLCVSGLIFLISIFLKGWSLQSILALVASGIFLFLMPHHFYTVSNLADFSVISFFLLSTAVDRTDDKLFKRIVIVKLMVAVVVLGLYNFDILPDAIATRNYGGQEFIRHSYGFLHPNSLGMYLVSIIMDVALLQNKKTVTEFLILLSSLLLVYAVTDSRMAFLISVGVLVLLLCKPLLAKGRLGGSLVVVGMLAILYVGISLSASYNPDDAFLSKMNTLLSTRLSSGHEYIKTYGFSLYPRSIHPLTWETGNRIYNDNFYIDSLLRQGIVVFALYPIVLASQLFKRRFSLYHISLFLLCLLGAMVEEYGASVLICSPLLIGYSVYEDKTNRRPPSEWLET